MRRGASARTSAPSRPGEGRSKWHESVRSFPSPVMRAATTGRWGGRRAVLLSPPWRSGFHVNAPRVNSGARRRACGCSRTLGRFVRRLPHDRLSRPQREPRSYGSWPARGRDATGTPRRGTDPDLRRTGCPDSSRPDPRVPSPPRLDRSPRESCRCSAHR